MRGRPPAVRVQATVAVDEPVLTVTLAAGCAGKVSRTYTFLSELPTTVARSTSPVDVSRLPSAGGVESPRGAPAGAGARAVASAPPVPAAVPAAPDSRPMVSTAPAAPGPTAPRAAARPPVQPPARSAARPPAVTPPAKAAAAPSIAGNRPRLVVEPLDLWMDRPVALRTSPELLVTPSDQPSAQRAQAAAVWKSLNAQPEDVQDSDRLKALEADMAALRAQASRDRASAAQVQQQLEVALSERFPATVVYVLGGLLLAALLLVAWTWTRLRSASEKAVRAWRDSVAAMGGRDLAAAHDAAMGLSPHPGDTWAPPDTSPHSAPAPLAPRTSGRPALASVSGAAPLVPAFVDTSPVPSASVPLAAAPVPAAAAAPAREPALHIVSPEELFDIQQQAEFFISVGEHQQAIEVLKKHIAERGDISPLAYLELLRLYHTLSRVDEFTQLRAQFMQSFNAQVPEFASFHRTGRMLYHYTDALAEIEAEWTSPSVLLLLEKMLFRRAGAEPVEAFDLAAYDDLLLLLAIAQTTPASARGEPAPRKRTTPLAPPRVETEVVEEPARASATRDASPMDSLAASLEFDFGEVPRKSATPAPQPAPATASWPRTEPDTRGAPLDLDLSEPPHLTLSDLPPVPVTAPPAAGQAVGFGMDNDLMELRLELEQKKSGSK
ncbi:hypothetical protein LJR129_002990 [Acidovorax sp. LjRoot129]|uniref:hypothetical protein n=1 Tax=Acidovorax sp. LjRoot129 TaxID=3342260 RepID=UPI003ED0AFF4